MAVADTEQQGADEAPVFSPTVTLGRLPLLVQNMEASNVEGEESPDGKAKIVPAYEVTFKAVIPEALLMALAAAIRDHRIVVRVQDPEGVEQ